MQWKRYFLKQNMYLFKKNAYVAPRWKVFSCSFNIYCFQLVAYSTLHNAQEIYIKF